MKSRDGAHRNYIPRQRDRARSVDPDSNGSKPRARKAQRYDRRDDFAIQNLRRECAEQTPRRIDAAGNEFDGPQQGRRHGLPASGKCPKPRYRASENVTVAASSVEELAASIGEIASQ